MLRESCTVSRSTVSLRAADTPRASVGALLRSARQWAIGRRHHPFPHQQAVRALGAWATCLHVQRHFGASGSLLHIASVFTHLGEALATSAITSRISLNVLLFLPLNFEYSLHVQELPPPFVKRAQTSMQQQQWLRSARWLQSVNAHTCCFMCRCSVPKCRTVVWPSRWLSQKAQNKSFAIESSLSSTLRYAKKKSTLQTKNRRAENKMLMLEKYGVEMRFNVRYVHVGGLHCSKLRLHTLNMCCVILYVLVPSSCFWVSLPCVCQTSILAAFGSQ